MLPLHLGKGFPLASLTTPPSLVQAILLAIALLPSAANAQDQEQQRVDGNDTTKTLPKLEVKGRRPASAANKLTDTPRHTPHSMTVIDRERLEAQNLSSLEQVMAQVPGITVDLSGTAVVPAFYSRGFQIEAFLYDGVPLQTGGSSWTQPDTIAFERIEVLRGATGLTTGAGYPGGAINLIRKRPTAEPQLSLALSASSWDRYRVEVDASDALTADGRVRGRAAMALEDTHYSVDVANQQRGAFYAITEADLGDSTTLTFGG